MTGITYRVRQKMGRFDILATRVLAHPHVNEQPFTRSLSDVKLPNNAKQVEIRGHDSVHAYGGKTLKIETKEQRQ